MFVIKHFTYLTCVYLKIKRCFNVKFSTYYFHMKTKILADIQICISVSLKLCNFIIAMTNIVTESPNTPVRQGLYQLDI